jgi:hypothetical protein
MQKAIPSPNLTAVLATAALADLLLVRLASHVFLPSQPAWGVARVLSDLGVFMSNLGGVLGVVLVAVVLLRAVRGRHHLFRVSMRITVSTIGLFFVILASGWRFWCCRFPGPLRGLPSHQSTLSWPGSWAAGLWHRRWPPCA